MNNIQIIKLSLSRWEEYKNLRLEALRESPTAFQASPEEYDDKKDDYWQKKLKCYQGIDGILFFAEDAGKLVGMVGVDFNQRIKRKHAVTIVGMYVNQNYRGKGIATLLLDTAIKEIQQRKEIIKIDLDVNTENQVAINLYQKFGFEIVGTYHKELYVNGKYYDFYEMEKLLN